MKFDKNRTAFFRTTAPEYNENWKPINRSQADILFKEKSYYFGSGIARKAGIDSSEGVPIAEACKLFGWKPVKITLEADRDINGPRWIFCNNSPTNDSSFHFLTWNGFMNAVIVCNEKVFEEEDKLFSEAWQRDIEEEDKSALEPKAHAAGKQNKRGKTKKELTFGELSKLKEKIEKEHPGAELVEIIAAAYEEGCADSRKVRETKMQPQASDP